MNQCQSEYAIERISMRVDYALNSADPGVGIPSGCADDQTQNSQFGMARADRPGDQVAEHIGGSARPRSRPVPMTHGDRQSPGRVTPSAESDRRRLRRLYLRLHADQFWCRRLRGIV